MGDTKSTETTEAAVETVEVATPKGKQLGAVFSDAEQAQLDELRGALNLNKNSEVIKRAVETLIKVEAERVEAYKAFQAQYSA